MFHFSRNSIYVFGLSIHYYGILIALGVLLGVLLAAVVLGLLMRAFAMGLL